MLGLYFRSQGEYPVAKRLSFNRGLFYWVGTRELLHEGWRWFTACVQHSSATSDDSLLLLAGSLLQRVDRALEVRDDIHLALNQPQNNDTQDDALTNLDAVLVNLMGAVDVAARVAHRILALPAADEYGAAWQRKAWRKEVRKTAPALAGLVEPATTGAYVLTILRLLRNSVHGTALQGMAYQNGAKALESLVGLPASDEADVRAAMNATGGTAAWGARPIVPGRFHLDPGLFVDHLFVAGVELLNDLLRLTPVETLAGVALGPEDVRPPSGSASGGADPFEPWIRRSIRWQMGLT